MTETAILDNGIQVVYERMDTFRSFSMGVWINAGSVFEDDNTRGASHFIEHMLFKGTDSRSAEDIAVEMDAIGGNLNAFTAKECTCFYAKVLDEHMETAADMLSDMLIRSRFDPEDIKREQGVVCEEILMTEDSPEDLVHERLCQTLFDGAPLGKPILGSSQSVNAFDRATLINYMDRHYTTGNIVIACAGSFEPAKLMDTLNKKFGDAKRGERTPMPESRLRESPAFNAITKDVEQTHICFGLPGYSTGSEEQYALYVLNNALGGGTSSRLFQNIREKLGLAYSVYSYPSAYAHTGYFTMYAGTGEKQAGKVCELMLAETERLCSDGITEAELTRSREQLKGSYILGQESTSARANAIGKSFLTKGRVDTDDEVLARVERVDMDAVRGIIPQVFTRARMSVTLVGRSIDDSIKKIVQGE